MIEFCIRKMIVMISGFGTREEGVFYLTPYICATTPSDKNELDGFGLGIGWGYWGAVILLGWASR